MGYNCSMNITATRTTKYTVAVLSYLQQHSHSTNFQIAEALRHEFPELSKTTVHRVTARLVEQRKIGNAPASKDNAARFDSNVLPHDHFKCRKCDRLRDIVIPHELLEEVQDQLGKCRIDGTVVITGLCGRCNHQDRTE